MLNQDHVEPTGRPVRASDTAAGSSPEVLHHKPQTLTWLATCRELKTLNTL